MAALAKDTSLDRRHAQVARLCAGAATDEEAMVLAAVEGCVAEAERDPACSLRALGERRAAQLLGAGAHDQFALEWLGPDCGAMLSRGPRGLHLATLALPGGAEIQGSGESLALALAEAVVSALALSSPAPLRSRCGSLPRYGSRPSC